MRGFALPLSSFREMRFRMRILLEWLQLRLVAQTAHAQRDTGTAGDSLMKLLSKRKHSKLIIMQELTSQDILVPTHLCMRFLLR